MDTNRPFQFQKSSQFFISAHNETLTFVMVCVSNPYCSPGGIHGCDTAPTPTSFGQIYRALLTGPNIINDSCTLYGAWRSVIEYDRDDIK